MNTGHGIGPEWDSAASKPRTPGVVCAVEDGCAVPTVEVAVVVGLPAAVEQDVARHRCQPEHAIVDVH